MVADNKPVLQVQAPAVDLAVVDLFLRQGHGFGVLRRCRRNKPHQKAVVLSNYSREPVPDYAREAGADAFFDKSFDLDAFVQFCISQSAACKTTTAAAQ